MHPRRRDIVTLLRLSVTTLAVTPLVDASPAAAAPDSNYAFQIDLAGSARAFEDASVVQFALPRKTRVRAGGKTRTVGVRGFTSGGPEGPTEIIRRLRGRYPQVQNAMVERALTATERRYAGSVLAWIDGDVLAVHPSHRLCTDGASLGEIRELLRGSARGYAPAGLSGDPERLFGVTRYGSAIRAVSEASALNAVATDPTVLAAVAWSAARDRLARGEVCAVPLGGVTPTEATLRDRSYRAAVHMTYAYSRATYSGWRSYVPRWYRSFLRGSKVADLLRSTRGRKRLLP